MQVVLSDHNCEGQAKVIFDLLRYDGTWLELSPIKLIWFRDLALSIRAKDEEVWRLCQEQNYLLLTGNRTNDDKEKSLEFARLPGHDASLSSVTSFIAAPSSAPNK